MKRKGFVLMETIIVISVLCVILIALFVSFSTVLLSVEKRTAYDNTEYLYKTSLVRNYLESVLSEAMYDTSSFYTVCRNSQSTSKCHKDHATGEYQNDIFYFLGVESVYITVWNVANITPEHMLGFEATTQKYLTSIDSPNEQGFRIVVMFKNENDEAEALQYQYASLRFGSRG